jgi:hypothetical protein
MGFIQPCFIRKNTAELRRKLESLGYKKGDYPLPVGREDVYDRDIHLYENSYHFRDSTLYGITNNIDCGTNEELFIAIASLRDDTDINQWFIYNSMDCIIEKLRTIDWFICNENSIEDCACYDSSYLNCHKATVEEIIEHFKK